MHLDLHLKLPKLPALPPGWLRRYAPYIGGGIVVIAAVLITYRVMATRTSPPDPQEAARDEVAQLVAAIGKLYLLPTGETPVVATVSDPSKLASQPFFKNAKKGDKVLIYNVAQKAILYDPVANILVEVAPLSLGAPTPVPK